MVRVRTWTRPGPDCLDPVCIGPGPGPRFSGLDLEVQVHGPLNLPGPDPDLNFSVCNWSMHNSFSPQTLIQSGIGNYLQVR